MLTKARASILAALLGGAGFALFPTQTPVQPLASSPVPVQTTTLRAVDGVHFVSVWPEGDIVADKTWEQTWETFTLEPHGDKVAFKTFHGTYCAAEEDFSVFCNRTYADIWELWTPVRAGECYGFKSHWGKFLVAEGGGGGQVLANRDALGPWETFCLSGSMGGVEPLPPPVGLLARMRVSESGRWFRTDEGLVDWREVSAFSLLSRMLRGEEEQVRALLRQYRSLGFTVTRVMVTLGGDYWEGRAGSPLNYSLRSCPDDPARYWSAFDRLVDMHQAEGLRTRVVIFGALECFGGVWDPQARRDIYQGEVRRKAEAFALELVRRLRDQGRTHVQLELANEPAAIGMRDSSRALRDLGRRVKQEWPDVMLNLGDVNGMDFADAFDGAFNAVDRHVDRNNGLRFIEADKRMGEDAYRDDQPRPLPAISGEPKNMGELRLDGRNGDVATHPISAYSYAAVTRSRQILPNFHYDGGLWTTPIKPETVASMKAFHQALNAFPMLDANRFRGHWSEAQGNWWKRDPYPGTDDVRDIERHVREGRGPWRVFGLGDFAVAFPYRPGANVLGWTNRPATVMDRYADDLYEVAIVRKN